jgi:hypothetical protein
MNAASETVTAMSQGLTAGLFGAAAFASTEMEAAVIARPLKCTQAVGDKPILEPEDRRSWRETLADSFASFIIREEFCSSFTGKTKTLVDRLESRGVPAIPPGRATMALLSWPALSPIIGRAVLNRSYENATRRRHH